MRLPSGNEIGTGLGGPAPGRVLVACIGNDLVADDAVGCAVHERLAAASLPEGVRLELLAAGGFRLLDALRDEEILIVVDAVQLGASAGTVHVLEWNDIPDAPGLPVTAHGIGIREVIDIGRILGDRRIPARITLVGIEGRDFDGVGRPMTPEVEAAVGEAAGEVLRLAGLTLPPG